MSQKLLENNIATLFEMYKVQKEEVKLLREEVQWLHDKFDKFLEVEFDHESR